MALSYENPNLLYRLIDELGNNRLFSFIYTSYIKKLNFKGNEKVLDFGSGSGAGSRHLAKVLQNGGHLTCVDISKYWTNKAKKRLRNFNHVEFLVGQLPEMELKTNSFDIIYIFYTLHDVSPDLRNGIVREFYKILKEGGKIYIKEPKRQYDGMPVAEIVDLMVDHSFVEEYSLEKKGTYTAVYRKDVAANT
ncbi:MAG: class I SAM-dependent methyltransferase [Bacteroidota bacterium]|nr:class I SAM-dependent methyltransferase [Bacteroidota bacterium]